MNQLIEVNGVACRQFGQASGKKVIIIGVAGGSGSGKSTICASLARTIAASSEVIMHDNYYRCLRHMPPSQRAKVNFDHPESLETSLLCQHLDALRLGSIVQIPTYCFAEHARLDETIQMSPSNVVFVDGVLVLSEPALRSKFDFSVYVHTDDRVRLQRRIDRDVVDRGRTPGSVVDQWNESVMPMHRQFVEPSRQFADCEIQNNDDSLPEIDRIVEKINASL